MTQPGGDALAERPASRSPNLLLAVAIPLTVAGIAYALAVISDRLVTIGPLDRATFGWSVVVPTWAVAPLAAGFAWRHLTSRARAAAAFACALVIGGIAAALVWLGTVSADCATGPARAAIEWLVPAAALGVVIGGGFAVSSLGAGSSVRAGHPWRAALYGAVGQLVVVALGAALLSEMFFGICQRPS
ncbi:MAG TPA: hypothetical protein VGM49_04440 [Candidatus Limnocylindrales bacterium]